MSDTLNSRHGSRKSGPPETHSLRLVVDRSMLEIATHVNASIHRAEKNDVYSAGSLSSQRSERFVGGGDSLSPRQSLKHPRNYYVNSRRRVTRSERSMILFFNKSTMHRGVTVSLPHILILTEINLLVLAWSADIF